MFKVLLVEDSTESYQLISRALGSFVQLEWAKNQREGASILDKKDFDLILMDVMLPDGDGFQLCSMLQNQEKFAATPIIFLTAKTSIPDRVMAFSVGADDFISKPFDSLELRARVEAKLRKRERTLQAADVVICNGLEINKRTQKVSVNSNGTVEELDLTPMEFRILLLLAGKPNAVMSRDQILDTVWGENVHVYSRSVDTHISKLRKKLGGKGESILSVHGSGYRLVSESAEPAPRMHDFSGSIPNLRFGRSG
jgi:two-component system phosphate regulon response regulator PhoB